MKNSHKWRIRPSKVARIMKERHEQWFTGTRTTFEKNHTKRYRCIHSWQNPQFVAAFSNIHTSQELPQMSYHLAGFKTPIFKTGTELPESFYKLTFPSIDNVYSSMSDANMRYERYQQRFSDYEFPNSCSFNSITTVLKLVDEQRAPMNVMWTLQRNMSLNILRDISNRNNQKIRKDKMLEDRLTPTSTSICLLRFSCDWRVSISSRVWGHLSPFPLRSKDPARQLGW